MSTILKTYALTFTIKHQTNNKTGQCDTTNNNYTTLANFIYEINWSSEAERLVETLNTVLNKQNNQEEFQTHYLIVEVNKINTIFVDIDNPHGFSKPELIIPTIDFRNIMTEWRNFLQKSGL